MADQSTPKGWGFIPIDTSPKLHRLLKEAFKSFSPVIIWTKDQSRSFETRTTVFNEEERIIATAVPQGMTAAQFTNEITQDATYQCYFCMQLPLQTLFFKCQFKGNSNAGLQFSYPERVFKVQRRRASRWVIRPGYTMKIQHENLAKPGTLDTRKVLQISEGGMAFVIDPEEAKTFQVGTLIKNVKLVLKNQYIRANAEVRHVQKLPATSPYTGLSVGIAFKEINAADVKIIANYVMEETLKYNSRFL